MESYIDRVKEIRKKGDPALLISNVPPFGRVSPDTIARWLKDTMRSAGIDPAFTAHSTRSAAVSKANTAGVSVESIFKAACWANSSSVFKRFYLKEIAETNNAFQSSVLWVSISLSTSNIDKS
jgi:hypothetical protein